MAQDEDHDAVGGVESEGRQAGGDKAPSTPMSMATWNKIREQMTKIAARAQGLG